MRDRRGAVARATGLAESVAAAVRRRQQARLPRAVLYDLAGEPRLLRPEDPAHEDIIDVAELLVELVREERPDLGALDPAEEEERWV